MSTMSRLGVSVAVVGLLWLSPGWAQVQYSQNFDGLTSGAINNQDGWAQMSGTPQVQTTYTVSGSGKALLLKPNDFAYRTGIFTTATNYPWRVAFDFMYVTNCLSYTGVTANVSIQDVVLHVRGPYASEQGFLIYQTGTLADKSVYPGSPYGLQTRGTPTTQYTPTINIQTGIWYHAETVFSFLPGSAGSMDTAISVTTNSAVVWDPPLNSGLQNDGNVNYIGFGTAATYDTLVIDNLVTEYLTPDGTIYWQE